MLEVAKIGVALLALAIGIHNALVLRRLLRRQRKGKRKVLGSLEFVHESLDGLARTGPRAEEEREQAATKSDAPVQRWPHA